MREIDQKPPYACVRRLIQLLLWQKSGRYLGRTPHRQENLDELAARFKPYRERVKVPEEPK